MTVALVVILIIAGCFSLVVIVGPPYLPTLSAQTKAALDMIDLKPGQTLLELGSGDGRVLIAAAKRGLNVVGYEINPILVVFSWVVTLKYRKQVKIVWGDLWNSSWPPADGIFTFLLQRQMKRLDNKIIQWHTAPVRLVSFAFTVPAKKPVKQSKGVYLYEYQ